MTKEELHKIGTALRPFLQWLGDTEKGEKWHDTRRQLWAHVDNQIAALVDKPADKPAMDPRIAVASKKLGNAKPPKSRKSKN